ncbi:MAG: hypothetical protein L0338_06605 [Acidobacteria bacterium]|nr:hypothetical protein [Acidobacteriota bacterium]
MPNILSWMDIVTFAPPEVLNPLHLLAVRALPYGNFAAARVLNDTVRLRKIDWHESPRHTMVTEIQNHSGSTIRYFAS